MKRAAPPSVALVEVDAHINDAAFAEAALAIFDGWTREGLAAAAKAAAR